MYYYKYLLYDRRRYVAPAQKKIVVLVVLVNTEYDE